MARICLRLFVGLLSLGASALSITRCARWHAVFPGASIFIISIDTLRSDHLPAYGYREVETPNIDGLADEAILFESAYAHVPLTLPSHTTLFTGLLPADNGVRDNVGFTLTTRHETMASFFGGHGYATGGAVSAVVLSHETGIARGFSFYEDAVEPTSVSESLGRVRRAGRATERKLVEWISTRIGLGSRPRPPLFVFLHLYEPHAPYDPPEPFASRYRNHPYDGEIAAADAVVGEFVKELKARRLYDEAIVVLLSDHGEGLGDHGEAEHGVFLYREALQVPLLVKLPGGRRHGERLSAPVALTDVFPSLAAWAGLEPPPGLAGRRLDSAPSIGQAIFSETLYPRFHLGWSDLASLTTARHQYIDAPRPELYDLVADPSEKRDLAATLPDEFRQLRLELARIRQSAPQPGAADPEHARKLAALGYLTGTSPAKAGPLPDPKDSIREIERLKEAFGFFSRGEYEQASKHLASLLDTHPTMSDAWEMYAQTLRRVGRTAEALAAYRAADRLTPSNAPLLLEMATLFLETGQLEDARRYAALAQAAGSPQVHEVLAQIALASSDLPSAEREARQAVSDRASRRIPLLILARVSRDRGELSQALVYLDQAQAMTRDNALPQIGTANGLRGDVLARMGDAAGAESAFREEIRLFPQNPQTWCSLALLYAAHGREPAARQTLLSLVRAEPQPASYAAAVRTAKILADDRLASALESEEQKRFGVSARRTGIAAAR